MRKIKKDLYVLKRNKILEAASTIFIRKGFHKTQMEDVAEKTGVAKGTLYLYFKSKEELFAALLEYIFEKGTSGIDGIACMKTGTEEKLRLLLKKHLEFCEENQEFFEFVHEEFKNVARTLNDSFKQKFMKKQRNILRIISEIMEQGIREKLLKPFDPLIAAMVFEGIIQSIVQGTIMLKKNKKLTDMLPVFMDIFLEGLGRGET